MSVPATMLAARLYAWGDVRVEEVPVPVPAPGEALVRVDACGVCGSDALDWYVDRKAAGGPVVLGHEPVGAVAALGDGVDAVRVGQRVFVHHHAPCLTCAECRRGLWSSCAEWRSSAIEPGGFAEYARVPAANLERDTLPLPDSMDDETAVFIEPLATCIRALRRQARVGTDDAVHVLGLGAMGLLLTQLARAEGAARVFGSDFVAERRELALELGADAAFEPVGAAAAVREATGGRGADVVVVCPGDARAIVAGLEAAAPGGRVVCFTPLPPGQELEIDQNAMYFREVALLQSYSCGPDETRAALRLLEDGAIDVAGLVTHRAALDGVAAALERAKGKGEGIKTIIRPHGPRP